MHIEQKNWTHVRRLLGYVRYDTEVAREAINDLYQNELRLFQNLFLPSVKLARTERVGSRLRRLRTRRGWRSLEGCARRSIRSSCRRPFKRSWSGFINSALRCLQ